MAGDLTDLVRSSCREATEHGQWVQVDHDALDRLADELAAAAIPSVDRAPQPVDREGLEAAVGLVLALDAVNFGSGWHDVVQKRPRLSGARTMAAGLRDHVGHTGPLTPRRLRDATPARCAQIFGQAPDNAQQMELMTLFASALQDLGRLVCEQYDGSFVALVEAAGGSAVALADSLLSLAMYRDRARIEDTEVHFYKRAQITPADVHREIGVAPCRFDDLDRLTAFADNLVPHVLRVDGVLRYEPALGRSIDAGRLLEPGSRPEVEIRAGGVHAVERLVSALAERGRTVRAMDLDLLLWRRGAAPRYKAIPRHRARTVFY